MQMIATMTLGNMRANGVRSLDLYWSRCNVRRPPISVFTGSSDHPYFWQFAPEQVMRSTKKTPGGCRVGPRNRSPAKFAGCSFFRGAARESMLTKLAGPDYTHKVSDPPGGGDATARVHKFDCRFCGDLAARGARAAVHPDSAYRRAPAAARERIG